MAGYEFLDWSKLPPHLSYLAQPSAKYGALQFDDPIYEFLQKTMTSSERDELLELGKLMSRDWDAIERWLDEYSMTDHPEAARVYFTAHLMAIGNDLGVL